jgi:hypothetical protein
MAAVSLHLSPVAGAMQEALALPQCTAAYTPLLYIIGYDSLHTKSTRTSFYQMVYYKPTALLNRIK